MTWKQDHEHVKRVTIKHIQQISLQSPLVFMFLDGIGSAGQGLSPLNSRRFKPHSKKLCLYRPWIRKADTMI